jgi:hypothetical protein
MDSFMKRKEEILPYYTKVKKILHESGIIDDTFSGKLYFEINRGGLSKVKRIEEIK